MKFAVPLVALVLAAVPASAEARTATIEHNGQTLAVAYKPAIETSLRQVNIGPRSNMVCRWTSKVTVLRTAADASGRPIAALERVVSASETRSGERLGPCGVSESVKTGFAGGEQAIESRLASAASEDHHRLRNELASLAALSGSEHRVR